MNTRRGLGKGLGTGYRNLVYKDPYIHGLSAKGVKTSLYAMYGLQPRYERRKSFHGKAKVDVDDKGNKILYSYLTKVAEIKDGKAIVYGTYSRTTLRHIKEFLLQEGFKAQSSKQIMKDYNPDVISEEKLKMSKEQAKQEGVKVFSGDVGKVNAGNLVNYIMDFEGGQLPPNDTLELFSYLVKTGQAWSLQGSYGRTAQSLIDGGLLDKKGNILKKLDAKSLNDLFKLEVMQAVTVPSTEYDRQIPPDIYQRRVREVENYLTKEFGGATTVQGDGQFMDDDNKKIIREPVKVITSFAQSDGFKGKQKNLLAKIEDWKRRWKQKSMAYQVEDDLYMV
jgi:hypothetical protein